MYGRLIAPDKQPGVSLVGVGETRIKPFSKCVLKGTVLKSTNLCQDDHICAGLKVGIDRAIHTVPSIWDINSSTENCVYSTCQRKKRIQQNQLHWNSVDSFPFIAI